MINKLPNRKPTLEFGKKRHSSYPTMSKVSISPFSCLYEVANVPRTKHSY